MTPISPEKKMIKLGPEDRLCIAGLGGQGKTYLMRYLLSVAPDSFQPYIIDPLNQYTQFGDIGDLLQGGKRCVPNMANAMQEMEHICHKLHAVDKRILVVEEAEQFIPQRRPMQPRTASLIQMGRNWNVGIWGTTRRIQDINKVFFDLAQRVFFFRCGLNSRNYISDLIGADYIHESRPTKYRVNKTGFTITSLPPYHFIHFDLQEETAQVMCLQLGAREHIQEASPKSEAGRETVKKIAEAEHQAETEQKAKEEKDGRPRIEIGKEVQNPEAENKEETILWSPRGNRK